ncbi:tetratricopeptide repeat protein [Leptolyngbya ohadii]|uniref:tetratricopeptide repeat protein n=1 Tax=Leptolyngbya ohadii TaxID=1962290 RepID=UPI000B59F54D|nr:tetratricopeptide repeat protein [Leptolyngbya ohadii]
MTDEFQFWFKQGEQLADQGSYREALEQFDRVLAVQPNHGSAWVFRAVVLIHLDRFQEALESCDRALTANPTNAEAWLFRAVALQRLNRYPEAYTSYGKALGDRHSTEAQSQQPSSSLLPWNWMNTWIASLWQSIRGWA